MDLTDAALADGLCRPAGRKNRQNVELSRCERNWHRKDRANGEISGEKKARHAHKHTAGEAGEADKPTRMSICPRGLLHCKQACSQRVNVIVLDQFLDTGVEFFNNSLDFGFLLSDYVRIATSHFGVDFLDFVE